MSHPDKRFTLEPMLPPEEIAKTRDQMMFVFELMNATSLAQLDLVILEYLGRKAPVHYGPTVARIIEEKRAFFGQPYRPS
jgi:hypothetical protein